MAHDGGGSPHDLVVQSWIMFALGIMVYMLRLYARFNRLGWKWQVEDYLMLLAMGWYTTFVVTNIKIAEGGGSSLYPPEDFQTFTAADIAARVKGSKIEFASENCLLNSLYTFKACMILIYFQLTLNLKQNRLVKLCAAYTFLGWFATFLVLFLNCHPLTGYWTLPPPQQECATYFRYEVTQAVFNISSDIAILAIILPMLFRVKVAWKTKVPLVIIFSMGLVVVICACTSKYFTFRDIWDTSYQFWYLREASIALYTTNLPYVWSFARQTFRVLRPSNVDSSNQYMNRAYGPNQTNRSQVANENRQQSLGKLYRLDSGSETNRAQHRSESEENIIELKGMGMSTVTNEIVRAPVGDERESWGHPDEFESQMMKGQIRKTTEVLVEKHTETV